MIVAVAHPAARSNGELVRVPMTLASLVSSVTSAISGGARTPFTTADQNSIDTALNPAKSTASPRKREERRPQWRIPE